MSSQRHYLIDGYNVAHAIARGKLGPEELAAARANLLRRLRPLVDRTTAVTVFFDSGRGPEGPAPLGRRGVIEVVYASDADAAILEAVRRAADPTACVVVTRDRPVAGKAQQLGARLQPVGELLAELESPRPEGEPDPGEPPEKYGIDDGGGGDGDR